MKLGRPLIFIAIFSLLFLISSGSMSISYSSKLSNLTTKPGSRSGNSRNVLMRPELMMASESIDMIIGSIIIVIARYINMNMLVNAVDISN